MNRSSQNQAGTEELKYEHSIASTEVSETNEGANTSIEDPDTMISMIVLLLTCLGLAALAHVFV